MKNFHKIFSGLALALTLLCTGFLGADLATHNWRIAVFDAVFASIWLLWFVFLLKTEQKNQELDREMKQIDEDLAKEQQRFHRALDGLLDDFKKKQLANPHHQELSDKFDAIYEKIVGEDAPTDTQLDQVAKQFAKETNHKVKFSRNLFGVEVLISKTPIEKKPAKKKAPVKKPVTTKKGK